MKYLPDLVPPEKKILPGYFRTPPQPAPAAGSRLLSALAVAIAAASLAFIAHPLLALLLLAGAGVTWPAGKRWLETAGQFRLTPVLQLSVYGILLAILLPLSSHYRQADAAAAVEAKARADKKAAAELAAAQEQQRRSDSITTAWQQQAAGTIALAKKGAYEKALPALTALITAGLADDELFYYRAVCYAKAGRVTDALKDLKPLLNRGNDKAEQLYDRLNPMVKHIVGYVTRCADGTASYAKGRGARSHHGGVANWNDPVYETSRKYEEE